MKENQIFENVLGKLQSENIPYEVFEHEPVYTMEEAVAASESLPEENVKVLFAKAYQSKHGFNYCLLVWTGNKPVDFDKVANELSVKKIKLAGSEEVREKLGIEIGSLSPIGYVEDFPVVVDKQLFEQKNLYINPGLHDRTVKLSSEGLKQILMESKNVQLI